MDASSIREPKDIQKDDFIMSGDSRVRNDGSRSDFISFPDVNNKARGHHCQTKEDAIPIRRKIRITEEAVVVRNTGG